MAAELEATEVVVGLPLSLSGARTASTDDAVAFAGKLAAQVGLPVRLVDERLSTVTAQQALRASGRNSRNSRPVIDQVAAVIILQHALDFERSIAEVEELVEIGAIDPDQVHLPGIYVDRIVVNATPEKRIEQRTIRQEVA